MFAEEHGHDDEFLARIGPALKRPSRAAERRGWKRLAKEELDDLADMFGIEGKVRL